jgi:Carboxypeptidase regulatory-like domain
LPASIFARLLADHRRARDRPAVLSVPGATVKVTSIGTNISASTRIDQTGSYVVPELIPGNYAVQVEAKGFKTFVQHLQVGMEMDAEVWSHAVFSKNLERLLNEEIAEAFFRRVVKIAQPYLWDEHFTVDGMRAGDLRVRF